MRILLKTLIILFVSSFNVHAQTIRDNANDSELARLGKRQTVDTSFLECVYEHCTHDPFFNETRIDDEILEIGRKASRYGSYPKYVKDSIIATDYPAGISKNDYDKLRKRIGSVSFTETLKDFNSGKLKHFETIFTDHYVYEENIPTFNWTYSDETDEICGYKCSKATTEFRGRKWIAWYSEEIPVDNGPLKFGGLPGLILKIEDTDKEHVIEAIQLRKNTRNFGYKAWSLMIPTDRKTFNKTMLDYKTDVVAFLDNEFPAAVNPDGSPFTHTKRRLFYNPVEKD